MYLGIEIGGTKLQFGVGAGDGAEFAAFERREVDIARGGEGIREQIREVGRALVFQHPIERIGIGFGGPVSYGRGIVQTSHQVAGWTDFPLVDWCEQELGRPTRLGNDCDCAALAEACFGAGKGKRSLFYVTVGTGIGGGLVLDRTVYGTDRPAAAEIGHLKPSRDGGPDVEGLAAGPAIASSLQRLIADVQRTDPHNSAVADLFGRCGGDVARLTTKMIGEAALAGNRLAKRAFADAAVVLGWAVAQVITLLAPEAVVIGGGVSLVGEEVFFKPLRAAVDQFVFEQLRGSAEIVPASLGERVVVHGALALAAGETLPRENRPQDRV
jgi:glucokinase